MILELPWKPLENPWNFVISYQSVWTMCWVHPGHPLQENNWFEYSQRYVFLCCLLYLAKSGGGHRKKCVSNSATVACTVGTHWRGCQLGVNSRCIHSVLRTCTSVQSVIMILWVCLLANTWEVCSGWIQAVLFALNFHVASISVLITFLEWENDYEYLLLNLFISLLRVCECSARLWHWYITKVSFWRKRTLQKETDVTSPISG